MKASTLTAAQSAVLGLFLSFTCLPQLSAEESTPNPLVESTIVEVVNQVEILSGDEMSATQAESEMLFQWPDFLQTGRHSRARLEAEDGTVTRVGANTLFSFEQTDRTINLKKGSLLFHSPTGKGGGRIVTASATASVVGTTIAVSATADGGFKLLVLEGVAKMLYPNGTVRILEAGQMTFVLPEDGRAIIRDSKGERPGQTGEKAGRPGPVLNFDLERLRQGSRLLNGFDEPLSSDQLIRRMVRRQQARIESGELKTTDAQIIEISEDGNLVLDTSGEDLVTSSKDLNDRIRERELERLKIASESTLTPQSDGFRPAKHFFRAPGVRVPDGFIDGVEQGAIARGLIAGNLNFTNGSLDISPILVTTTNAGIDKYILRATDNANFSGNFEFTGFEQSSTVDVSAISNVNFAAGSSIAIDSAFPTGLSINVSHADLDINDIDINNDQGRIELFSDLDVIIENADIQAGLGTILTPLGGIISTDTITTLPGTIETNSAVQASLFLEGLNIDVSNSLLVAEESNRIGATNTITIDSSLVAAQFIEFKAEDINLSTTDFIGSDLQLRGGDLVDFSNSDLRDLSSINMEARTLILSDIQFASGGTIRLGSQLGQLAANPNTGASALTGFVNFINDVKFDGQPAQNYVSTTRGGLATGPGQIRIYTIDNP